MDSQSRGETWERSYTDGTQKDQRLLGIQTSEDSAA